MTITHRVHLEVCNWKKTKKNMTCQPAKKDSASPNQPIRIAIEHYEVFHPMNNEWEGERRSNKTDRVRKEMRR